MKARAASCCALAAILLGGCQHSESPLRLGVIDEPSPAAVTVAQPVDHAVPFVNPNFKDEQAADGWMSSIVFTTGSAFGTFIDPIASSITWMSGDRPSHAVDLLEDQNSPDNRRTGMNKLADFGFLAQPVFKKRCRQIAEHDSDFTVRATAIREGNRARDTAATSVFIKGLNDRNEWVRLESAKALANVPDIKAPDTLISVLQDPDENIDVRVAAADALKHYRTLPVARALAAALRERRFVVAWQAANSLRYLTGRDFGYDESAWLAYFTGPEKPLG